jgi:hypothetical protein
MLLDIGESLSAIVLQPTTVTAYHGEALNLYLMSYDFAVK